MRRTEEFRLGSSDVIQRQEESFRLSLLDIMLPYTYNLYTIIFSNDGFNEKLIIETLKCAIEATLQQCRHLVGRIEKNDHGDYSIVRRHDSTVDFIVQWLNDPDDDYPSFSDLEKSNFSCARLGSAATLGVKGMPQLLSPEQRPMVVAFQLNLIREGFILAFHIHHMLCDITGTTSIIKQIADHCCSIRRGSPPPTWDRALMNRFGYLTPHFAPDDQKDAPILPPEDPSWLPCSSLLFHLPPAKAAELKRVASPVDGTWISTHDALAALLWRVVARNRAKIYHPDLKTIAVYGHPVNMRSRCTPPVSPRYQGNVLAPALSFQQKHPLTLAEVVSEASLAEMATFIRSMTSGLTQRVLDEMTAALAPCRDKSNLNPPLEALGPMSVAPTDWRTASFCDYDFGDIGQPMAFRDLHDGVRKNMILIYPPHKVGGRKEGIEVVVPFESHALELLLNDTDMQTYFEFRGIESADAKRDDSTHITE